ATLAAEGVAHPRERLFLVDERSPRGQPRLAADDGMIRKRIGVVGHAVIIFNRSVEYKPQRCPQRTRPWTTFTAPLPIRRGAGSWLVSPKARSGSAPLRIGSRFRSMASRST